MLLTPHLKRQGAQLIALTGNEQSSLAQSARRASRRRASTRKPARSTSRRPPAPPPRSRSATRSRSRCSTRAASPRGLRALASRRHARPAAADARRRRDAHRRRGAARAGTTATLAEAIVEMSRKGMGMTASSTPSGRVAGIFTDGDLRRPGSAARDLMRRGVGGSDDAQRRARSRRIASPSIASMLMEDAAEGHAAARGRRRRRAGRRRCTCTTCFARESI